MRLDELVRRLDTHLEVDAIDDYSPKGLQVEGRDAVSRVVTSVTASEALFREAVARNADAVLVHHGMFFSKDSPVVRGPLKRRLKLLLDNEISLLAYHLPLDRHPEVGNNAVAARALRLVDLEPWGAFGGPPIGFRGRLPAPEAWPAFLARVTEYYGTFGRDPIAFSGGRESVEHVGIVSGGAQGLFRDAAGDGLDCFITGESSEWVMHHAEENRLAFIGAGHYATERVGILALGEWMTRDLGVSVDFVEMPNPI